MRRQLLAGLAILTLLFGAILATPTPDADATEPTIIGDCDRWIIGGSPGDILDSNDPAVTGRVPGSFASPYDGSNGHLIVVIMFDGNTVASEHTADRSPECPPESTTTTTTTSTIPTTSTTTIGITTSTSY